MSLESQKAYGYFFEVISFSGLQHLSTLRLQNIPHVNAHICFPQTILKNNHYQWNYWEIKLDLYEIALQLSLMPSSNTLNYAIPKI